MWPEGSVAAAGQGGWVEVASAATVPHCGDTQGEISAELKAVN